MRASSRNHGMYFGADDRLSAAHTPTASARAASSDVMARFDQHFVVYDKATERPATGFSYGITTQRGEHHHILDENGATTKADAAQAESLTLTYLVQTTIGVRQ
ncbi:hypothetical protein FHW67_000718 [Herbaspirillum sp. Sphag1AN]|uniref:hypothetical protein n=1 Tax=unclassified Herbaspirillum TaxID=2624150 RepID=UPI00161CE0AF|nr:MULTISPECIES: hypothetical protein [unclassified Herbaspirillum]MBB3211470.1 hypothetical protein [Herbaspirillum sp. Sphag1AN]MBB3245264.1 hypothetical protein [Herbaspirillum sp. Sphag64]